MSSPLSSVMYGFSVRVFSSLLRAGFLFQRMNFMPTTIYGFAWLSMAFFCSNSFAVFCSSGCCEASGLSPGVTVCQTVNNQTGFMECAAGNCPIATQCICPFASPIITGLSMTSGYPGQVIHIYGNNFQNVTSVTFFNNQSATFSVVSPTDIQAVIPNNLEKGPIKVGDSVGNFSLSADFEIKAPPVLNVTNVPDLYTCGGKATFKGSGFLSGLTVTIGGVNCPVDTLTSTEFTCTYPQHALGNVSVIVDNHPSYTGSTFVFADKYVSPPKLDVTTIDPISGYTIGGKLKFKGSGFLNGITITIDGASCPIVAGTLTFTSLTCDYPAHALGTVTLNISNNPTYANGSKSFSFQYTNPPKVTVSKVSPNPGYTNGGTLVVTGSGFLEGITAKVDGIPCPVVTGTVTSNTFSCNYPSHAAGAVNIDVANNPVYPNSAYTFKGFKYVDPPTVTVTSITPNSIITAGEKITVKGAGFLSGLTATIDSLDCPVDQNKLTGKQFTCLAPAHAAGSVNVVVSNNPSYANGSYTYTGLKYQLVASLSLAISPKSTGKTFATLTMSLAKDGKLTSTITKATSNCKISLVESPKNLALVLDNVVLVSVPQFTDIWGDVTQNTARFTVYSKNCLKPYSFHERELSPSSSLPSGTYTLSAGFLSLNARLDEFSKEEINNHLENEYEFSTVSSGLDSCSCNSCTISGGE